MRIYAILDLEQKKKEKKGKVFTAKIEKILLNGSKI